MVHNRQFLLLVLVLMSLPGCDTSVTTRPTSQFRELQSYQEIVELNQIDRCVLTATLQAIASEYQSNNVALRVLSLSENEVQSMASERSLKTNFERYLNVNLANYLKLIGQRKLDTMDPEGIQLNLVEKTNDLGRGVLVEITTPVYVASQNINEAIVFVGESDGAGTGGSTIYVLKLKAGEWISEKRLILSIQ